MSEIVRKVETREAERKSTVQDNLDLGVQVRVTAEDLGNQKKRALVTLESPVGSTWSITCDEGAYWGVRTQHRSPWHTSARASLFDCLPSFPGTGK